MSASNFSQPLTRIDSVYFTVTTFATVGFGDITATTEAARLVVTGQMIADLSSSGSGSGSSWARCSVVGSGGRETLSLHRPGSRPVLPHEKTIQS